MTRIISIINYKGGTGKTSTVVNLAHGLSLQGNRVLIIDLDPQGSVGYYLGLHPKKTVYDLLIKGASISDCTVAARPNMDVICSNERLYPAELSMATMPQKERLLSTRLASLSGYDFVLLDCAPSMNLLNQNALLVASELILPVSMEYMSLMGVKQLLKNIRLMNTLLQKQIVVSKVVPTFYDKRQSKSKRILESLSRVFPGLVSSPIHASLSLSEAPGHHMTVFEYDPKSKGASDYHHLTREVLTHGQAQTI
jgi:chromosome partitioning protein